MLTSVLNLLRPFLLFSLLLLSMLLLSRAGLVLWQGERFTDLSAIATLIINGLRIDLSTLGYLLILPALFHPWFMLSRHRAFWLKCLRWVLFISFICVLFFELATPAFTKEYGFRPNRLFIEYLAYPSEVMKMLVNGHLLTLVAVFSLLIMASYWGWRIVDKIVPLSKVNYARSPLSSSLAFLLLLVVLFLCARGTVGHRPINPSFVYFSTDPLINSLTLNSIYSVAHAYKQFGNEKNAAKLYGKMPTSKVISLIQENANINTQSFTNKDLPSVTTRLPIYQGKPKNLVIILEESLGAQFVSSLGGLPLTPELDKLNSEGWAFKNMYATGTRSVRGIEAVITGFTPTPARSVVKLDKSQHGFFTIASLLKDNNYLTQFIYGGESHFDNMKSFFLGNGFSDIVDINDMQNPEFISSWGASDEDLFNQADIELSELNKSGKPFFSLVFTSSNHDPFDIPEGKVTLPEGHDPENVKRDLAIKYADYALGKFIAKAKTQDYWQDTVFLVVADHDVRVFGSEPVPLKSFHIPAVILNSDMDAKRDTRLVSQIDLPVTLLSLLGVEQATPMLGYDLTQQYPVERAMMQYYDNFAYVENGEAVILMPNQKVSYWRYDPTSKTQVAIDNTGSSVGLAKKALAHVLFSNLAYTEQLYRLPNKS